MLDYKFMAKANSHIQQSIELEKEREWQSKVRKAQEEAHKEAKVLAIVACVLSVLATFLLEVPH